MTKIAAFVDVQNIYYTTRDAYARQFNYRQLWQQISAEGDISHAYAYAIDRGDPHQVKFQDALRHIGFEVKLKPFIQRRDGSAKGDWDIGITLDVLDVAPDVDQVILLTGDGDFAPLVDRIKARHEVQVDVYGVEELTAKALINSANNFYPIDIKLLL